MLLIHGARQLALITNQGQTQLTGPDMGKIEIKEDPDCKLAILVDNDGKIAAMGPEEEVRAAVERIVGHGDQKQQIFGILNARGGVILPGFVDAHTHPIWAGDRVHEFAMKLAGATYLEIHTAGGGIHFTVENTKHASDETLLSDLKQRLEKMLRSGTTTVEVKSGYGLDSASEVRLLRLLNQASAEVPVELSITYCGAHAVPKNMNSEDATKAVIEQQLPAVRELMSEGVVVENADVFCEKGVFSADQTRRILLAAKEVGLRLNFHGDELSYTGSAELGAELGAAAVSHLEEISDAGIDALQTAGTAAVLLPTTAYSMRLKSPPVRKMIEKGVLVALGSDFNPNAHCLSMPTVMYLGCVTFQMSLSEALVSSTLNAAASLGRGKTHGSLQIGKVADLVLVNAPKWEHIIYQLGSHSDLINCVIKKGNIVYKTIKTDYKTTNLFEFVSKF